MIREYHKHTCRQCLRTYELEYSVTEFQNWQGGARIQDAMPRLTPGERELLISGICSTCFDKLFGEENEE